MSDVSLADNLKNLQNLDEEIKRTISNLKKLRIEKKRIEELVKETLEREQKPGVKIGNIGFFLQEKSVSRRKTKFEKENAILTILDQAGVKEPLKVFNQLSKAVGSEKSTVQGLTSKPIEKIIKLS